MFFSHPGIPLKRHLNDVGNLCWTYAKRSGVKEDVIKCAELVGKCHDLAKYTTFFQDHLQGKKVKGALSSHSRLSAILASWMVKNRLSDPFLPAVAFICVDSHHGNLKSFSLLDKCELNALIIRKQIESIKNNLNISNELDDIGLSEVYDFIYKFEDSLPDLERLLKKSIRSMKFDWNEERCWYYFYITLLLYSCLVDADKKEAGKISEAQFSWKGDLSSETVLSYIKRKFGTKSSSEINKVRAEIFTSVKEHLEKILDVQRVPKIMTITAPTGSGKTLLSLYIALKARERRLDPKPRVIYCLPYINIIEQTHHVFDEVFSDFYGKVPISLLLKHHHLFFPESKFLSPDDIPLDKLLLLTDSWESEVIVTTFEQLFRSIIGSENSLLKKFHNIANSILILDEVQTIPLEYWRLVRDALENLSKTLNVTIIMMTATMPTLFKGYELVPNSKFFFKQLDRTVLSPQINEPVSAEQFVDFFFSKWRGKVSALLVLNTVRASKIIYRKIAEKLGTRAFRLGSEEEHKTDECKTVLAYLSTAVIPKERERRIKLLNNLLHEGRPVILVSTQVVEAGVDLDFDMAIRDIGPLDSIIQIAGRCNRNWKKPKGEVFILRLIDERGREDSRKIYNDILPIRTIAFLNGKNINEKELSNLMDQYYNDISYRMNAETHQQSEKILNIIRDLNYDELKFSLIKEEPKIPVYIEIDDEANDLLNKLRESVEKSHSLSLDEMFLNRANIRKIRAEMEKYLVEVYSSEINIKGLKPIIEGIDVRHVTKDIIECYYDKETGFISSWEEETGGIMI